MAGVYVSYPFCAQKCTYCNFASEVGERAREAGYVEALAAEIRAHIFEWRPETLYLGGGTPARLALEDLERIRAAIPGRPWLEATIEAAPGDVSRERARAWRRLGINRVSLGVQSFVAREVSRTGRKHTAELVAAEIEILRGAGIGAFNIDLIAGLPGQTLASWEQSLDWIGKLRPGHVSVYMLEVDDDSRLGREMLGGGARYGAPDAPSEDLVADLYERAVERLGALGLARYEISNFARPGQESRHNLKYWRLEPYVGFGADAHSFDGRWRRRNAETAGEYVERWRSGQSPCVETTAANPAEERFFVGLRLAGGIRPLEDEWRRFEARIRHFVSSGLLEAEGGALRLTPRGMLFSNEVFAEFVNIP